MDMLIAAGLVCGVLAGIWIPLSVVAKFVGFVAFMAWATFYSCGDHGLKAFKSTLIHNITGLIWGWIMVALAGLFGPIFGQLLGLGIAVFIGTVGMIWGVKFIPFLTFIPGIFLGAASFFGAGYNFVAALIGLVCGAIIAYISEVGTGLFTKKPAQPSDVSEKAE